MEAQKEIKHKQREMEKDFVTTEVFDAVIPQLQRTMDEVRGDIKKLLVIVHNSNGKKNADAN